MPDTSRPETNRPDIRKAGSLSEFLNQLDNLPISIDEMALTLIHLGFKASEVYDNMGLAEFFYHYKTASVLIKRQQQIEAATLIGTVGSFFVKRNEKTIIETLQEDIDAIRGLSSLGINKTDEQLADEKRRATIEKGNNALQNLISGMSKSKGKIKVTKNSKPDISF